MATRCFACDTELSPDPSFPDAEYQFDNALWIGFHGGYGMFVDHLEAKLPNNSDERWLRNSDERDAFGLFCDFKLDDDGKLVDDPEWLPTFNAERMLPGQPDYEAVICHDCAHELCATIPWVERLLHAHNSHAHRTAWKEAHPEHYGWDYDNRDDQ